jgi:hypothetical protein
VLRNVVQTFLETLTEREFDAPLLAILSACGFTDIHFLHGSFEFGKDVIAKKLDSDGVQRQYAIQSKGGDLGAAEWRAVRPQLEECGYNEIAHPGFDGSLPRAVVLVTTGRLKGSASSDAQQFGMRQRRLGVDVFEVWDRDKLVGWMSDDPSVGLAGAAVSGGLLDLVLAIHRHTISEPALERHTRIWATADDSETARTACLETAVLCAALREAHRFDLAALLALHLLRAAWRPSSNVPDDTVATVALQLFETYVVELLTQVEPLLGDPHDLVRPAVDLMAIVTYPAMVCRLTELIGLVALSTADPATRVRAEHAVEILCRSHPGARRPPSDHFAVSLIPAAVVLRRADPAGAREYLRALAQWVIDRHDVTLSGLGLGSLAEDSEDAAARLLGGSLTFDGPERRYASYLATVVLDLLLAFGEKELYSAVLDNIDALRVVPTIVAADEARARWCRGGPGTVPHPRVDYARPGAAAPAHHARVSGADPVAALLLTATARSRHEYAAIVQLANESWAAR